MKRSMAFGAALIILLSISTVQAFAANGQGVGLGRTDAVNVNDYSTNNWDRFTFNYEFQSGPDTKEIFGVPTQTDVSPRNPELDNLRRNKDAAYLPPPYGVFSGEIPTNESSLYHSNVKPGYASNVTNYSSTVDSYGGNLTAASGYMSDLGLLLSTSTMQDSQSYGGAGNSTSEVSVSQYTSNKYRLTQVSRYDDGSIGTLKIPALNLSVKVFPGETEENMQKGAGHFSFTSEWDGNVGVAGHNRGPSAHFSGIWNLRDGDEIIYTTKMGSRIYEVFSVEKISDTDYSKLSWSSDNLITLITCSANESSIRWAVQASEK